MAILLRLLHTRLRGKMFVFIRRIEIFNILTILIILFLLTLSSLPCSAKNFSVGKKTEKETILPCDVVGAGYDQCTTENRNSTMGRGVYVQCWKKGNLLNSVICLPNQQGRVLYIECHPVNKDTLRIDGVRMDVFSAGELGGNVTKGFCSRFCGECEYRYPEYKPQ